MSSLVEASILPRVRAFGDALNGPTLADGPETQRLLALASRILARPQSERLLTCPLADTDMVDADLPETAADLRGAPPRGPRIEALAQAVTSAALSLDSLRKHPAIAAEFERSLVKRTPLWAPLILATLDELGTELSDGIVRLVAAWFTLIHLSGPLDHWIDDDPVAPHWSCHDAASRFDLLFALKDEALAAPFAAAPPVTPELARAVAELASGCMTASIGAYFDLVGALNYRPGLDTGQASYLHQQLVQWKSACLYRTLATCLAVVGGATDAQRRALENFGCVTGYCIQVLDDAGGIWGPGSDLDKDPVALTFPLIYGLHLAHPNREWLAEELARPLRQRDLAGIRAALNQIEALAFLEFLIEDGEEHCARDFAPLLPQTRERLLGWFRAYFRHQL